MQQRRQRERTPVKNVVFGGGNEDLSYSGVRGTLQIGKAVHSAKVRTRFRPRFPESLICPLTEISCDEATDCSHAERNETYEDKSMNISGR